MRCLRPLPALTLTVVCLSNCANGGSSARTPASGGLPTETSVAEPERPRVAATDLKDFPAVALDGLSDAQRAMFATIVNEEICPCDCPRSFGACLQAGSKCRPAILLGEWLAGQLADGVEGEVLAEQVAKEVSSFASGKKAPVTTGYSVKGAARPRHVVVEYADFECAHCKAAAPVVDELARKHAGSVQVVYKHFPLSFHAMATPAAEAVEAAGMQGRFWEMHDAVFATQTMLDEELLIGHAKAIGLDVAKWQTDRKSPKVVQRVADSRKEGEALGVDSTPTFLVNGRRFELMRTLDAFELRIAMEDARATASCQ